MADGSERNSHVPQRIYSATCCWWPQTCIVQHTWLMVTTCIVRRAWLIPVARPWDSSGCRFGELTHNCVIHNSLWFMDYVNREEMIGRRTMVLAGTEGICTALKQHWNQNNDPEQNDSTESYQKCKLTTLKQIGSTEKHWNRIVDRLRHWMLFVQMTYVSLSHKSRTSRSIIQKLVYIWCRSRRAWPRLHGIEHWCASSGLGSHGLHIHSPEGVCPIY